MKKLPLVIGVIMLFLVGCAQTVEEITHEPENGVQKLIPSNTTLIDISQDPEFKIIKQLATRSPPSISGTVKNIGLGRGDVKITGRVYYSGIIATERSITLTEVKPDEEVDFFIEIDNRVQWSSYTVVMERV